MSTKEIVDTIILCISLLALIGLATFLAIASMKTEQETKKLLNKKTKLEIRKLENQLEYYEKRKKVSK